ncbi:hypothetical protein [Pseudomonas abietaniphila]|uniref:Uncharacterized protein n=1 Tax=Pseudomonas abietaniphila TaxID=89065 RepID=A0A1G7ZJJ1_9PSED|nr:hypothetical protein [Pseudomonas abietaniphila]SDH08883.1 hypothetical protein SAMN05216605_104293 [Pseudomonas abietaniphila]
MIQTPVSYTPVTLLAPCLPQSIKQGIGALAATNLLVHINPYPEMESGDLIELFWGDCYVASTLLSASDIGHTSVLHVPESFLRSGKVKTYYTVTKIGGDPVKSPCHKLWVKLETPGGHLVSPDGEENQGLAPVRFADVTLCQGLAPEQFKKGVDIILEPYLNMEVHDEITLRWGDMRMDLPALTESEVGQELTVHVPATLISEAEDDLHQEITYCVIDRVGNNSRWAPARSIKARTEDSDIPDD